jgi:hypothetical protein
MDKKLNQQLDEKLRESYQQLSAKAPAGLWERLQQQLPEDLNALDQTLDDKVQASFEQLSAVAPAGVWAALQEELPAADALDQQLDEKIKAGFEEQTLKAAPLALWQAISEELPPATDAAAVDAQLDEKVKSSYEAAPLHAPQKVWLAVNRQLNIDRTWQRINAALDMPARRFDWKLRGLQLAIVLLLLLLWLRACHLVPSSSIPVAAPIAEPAPPTVQEEIASESAQRLEKVAGTTTAEHSSTQATNKNEAIAGLEQLVPTTKNNGKAKQLLLAKNAFSSASKQSTAKGTSTLFKNFGNRITQIRASEKQEQVAPMPNAETQPKGEGGDLSTTTNNNDNTAANAAAQSPFLAANFLQGITLPTLVQLSELELANAPKWKSNFWAPRNRLAAGVFTALNSTVLLNNDTKDGFDYNSLTTNYFGLAANYGLWARYRLTKKAALMAEYSINADHKQAYGVYEKGQFLIKEYVFKYNRVSLAYQLDLWQLDQGVGIDNKVTAQIGAYVGAMRAARVYYNSRLVNDRIMDYQSYDWGAKLAVGHEITIDHFIIGYGIRSDIGLANIFKGNQQIERRENRTNLIHLGAYLHLGYKF